MYRFFKVNFRITCSPSRLLSSPPCHWLFVSFLLASLPILVHPFILHLFLPNVWRYHFDVYVPPLLLSFLLSFNVFLVLWRFLSRSPSDSFYSFRCHRHTYFPSPSVSVPALSFPSSPPASPSSSISHLYSPPLRQYLRERADTSQEAKLVEDVWCCSQTDSWKLLGSDEEFFIRSQSHFGVQRPVLIFGPLSLSKFPGLRIFCILFLCPILFLFSSSSSFFLLSLSSFSFS